ncbi:hypothetical protein BCR43DRAFT_302358 [Syncephalastrum racemosum]|uniref:Uncharacterized protein n=1 Tax=Syncephalastrum racemosum TaxID=13706 RepID=A0A1X2HB98_SYNRA|nr:hypothetical protein BCR43DRAFT_302358 [Syncephalastrum racemosum]
MTIAFFGSFDMVFAILANCDPVASQTVFNVCILLSSSFSLPLQISFEIRYNFWIVASSHRPMLIILAGQT